jgi:4-amino-4-deoxy-L-arabinose transferase-like glycosyltransferase
VPGGGKEWSVAPWQIAAAASAAIYGALLVVFRPASPYEWDEVLFLRALDRYDVASHSPHPPGYPVYIAAGKLVRSVVRDPQLALELVAVAAAIAGLWFLWRTAREFEAPPAAAFTASAIVAVTPAFAFNANVGLSDVPGAAAATAAVWWLVRSRREPRHLPVAAALTAVALGVRPQLVFAVLIPCLLALRSAVRGRAWRSLLLATGSGIAVLLACWVPPVLVTGPSRFAGAVRYQAQWTAVNEAAAHLPGAPVGEVLEHWLILPFGSTEMAAVFWLLVAAGTVAWLRKSRRDLVLVAAGWGGAYLVAAMLTMNLTTSVRYIVPALPALALLAAGVVVASGQALRRAGATICVVWCAAVVAWGAPVYALRRAPAPAWEALEWVMRTYSPTTTTVLYQGMLIPHAPYLLEPRGFTTTYADEAGKLDANSRARQTVLNVGPEVPDGGEVLFSREWSSSRLRRLTRDRYNLCKVTRVAGLETGGAPPGWRAANRAAADHPGGELRVDASSRPAVARVCAVGEAVTVGRPGLSALALAPWTCADVALLPSLQGDLAVTNPAGQPVPEARSYLLPFGELRFPCRPSPAFVIPQVAHLTGQGGALWRTDVVVINPSKRALDLGAQLLWARRNASGPAQAGVPLPAGGVLVVRDVLALPEFVGAEGVGALLIYALDGGLPCRREDCSLLVWARTYNGSVQAVGWLPGEWLPGVAPELGLRGGKKATFSPITNDSSVRSSVGVASLSVRAVRVRVRVFTPSGELAEESEHEVGSFDHLHTALQAVVAGGRVEVEAVAPARDALLFPYVSLVDQATGAPTHLLPNGFPTPDHRSRGSWQVPPLQRGR